MPLSKLVLIDGHSLAYRAFYGLSLYDRGGKVHFTSARGEFAFPGCASRLLRPLRSHGCHRLCEGARHS